MNKTGREHVAEALRTLASRIEAGAEITESFELTVSSFYEKTYRLSGMLDDLRIHGECYVIKWGNQLNTERMLDK